MKIQSNQGYRFILWFFLIPIFILNIPHTGFAASTQTILYQIGSGAATQSGDYIGSASGLNTRYIYYIEVPPALGTLNVDLFDGDIGVTPNGNDWQIGSGFNTSCRYRLYNPAGTRVVNITLNSGSTAYNNAWVNIYNTANPAAGHWQLRVEMYSSVTGGDDVNGYGIRAHDGNSGAGGTELNIYADSFLPLGVTGPTGSTVTTTFFPYVTSGCTVDWNDFDADDDGSGTYGRLTYASRSGSVTGSYNGAANDVWKNNPVNNFETDLINNNSGLWTATARYTTLSGSTANFGVFWAGNWQAVTGAPSAQPQANSFRVYLPSDGDGAPAKPFVTQKISFVSGPNPPVSGSPTRVRVEIAVFNPAAQAITFSNSNVVAANVPATRVVYRGNVLMSHGSLVSQPVDGGSGTVAWNPGTLAAGATATLYYQIDVTPSVSNQYTEVTGIATLNGTTARYVDTTGNTSQAAATYTYGPLCGLRVYSGSGGTIPTWVAVTCFEACAQESQPTLEWHTASETGAVGFYLWRQDRESKEFELVNPNFLPALPNSPQGGVYRLADPGAQYGEPVVYRLEEIDASGRTMSYGPFSVDFAAATWQVRTEDLNEKIGREEPTDIYGFQRFGRQQSTYEKQRLQARLLERQRGAALAAKGKDRSRITVKGRGMFYVNSGEIARSLGLSVQQVEQLITQQKLNLSAMGKNIAWLADRNGAGIFFYSEGNETVFSDRNVFWLERKNGLAMETIGAGNSGPVAAGQSYKEFLHFEENHYALTSLFTNSKDDIWLWDYVIGGGSAKSFPVHVPGVAASGTATLTVTLQGETDTAAANDHHAIVSLNGRQIGDATWDGARDHVFQATFSQSLLNEGANTLTVSAALDMGAPYSIFYVESFDLSYQREYKAVSNALLCRGDGNPVISVSGFTEMDVVVLDVSKPDRPKQVTGVGLDVSGRVTFVPRAADKDYLVSGLNAALRPLAVVGDRPAQLKGAGHSAEYLVIAPEEFKKTAQKLADYRKAKGMSTMVVTLEDIYESFNFGMSSPLAVRDFLAYAYSRWGGRKVKYAVLAGKGTYDYKDHLGLGDNLFPVILAKTPTGLFAADKEFGDVKGKDGLPEIAIGRLPAVTNGELQSMIDKIKAYDGGQGPWTERALMIADNDDDGGDFASSSDDLAGLAGYQSDKIYLANPGQAGEVRARIIAAFNSGAALVNYVGHAGLNQLAQENIFNVANASQLQNGGQLPLMVMLTCVAGRFEIPGFTSLGEALLLNRDGGSAGGLVPSGAPFNSQSVRLGEEFYKAVFRGRETSVGQALLAAMKNYLQQGGMAHVLNVYNWLGDPALAFK